jgi:DNA-binding NtrC family response regulator
LAANKSLGGFVCGEAVDGLDAIQKASSLNPDLIVLDFQMPRMNGLEAARVLNRADNLVHVAQRPASGFGHRWVGNQGCDVKDGFVGFVVFPHSAFTGLTSAS